MGQRLATVRAAGQALAGKVVVSMANALVKDGREMLALIPPRGSVAAALQAALPGSMVAAAFHHLPASELEDLDSGLEADVLVCSDHAEATRPTMDLVGAIDGLRPLDAGSLARRRRSRPSPPSASRSTSAPCTRRCGSPGSRPDWPGER